MNNRVRAISASGVIQTIAGNGSFGFCGDGGPAKNACLAFPQAVAIEESGGRETLFIADSYNNRVRKVDLATRIIRTAAGNEQLVTAAMADLRLALDLTGPRV